MPPKDWIDIRVLAPDTDLTIRGIDCAHGALFAIIEDENQGVLQLTDSEGMKIPDGQVGRLAACVVGGMTQARKIAFDIWSGEGNVGKLSCSASSGNGKLYWQWSPVSDDYEVCLEGEPSQCGADQGLSLLCLKKSLFGGSDDFDCAQSVAISAI